MADMRVCPLCSNKMNEYKRFTEYGPSMYGVSRLISHQVVVCEECGLVLTYQIKPYQKGENERQ